MPNIPTLLVTVYAYPPKNAKLEPTEASYSFFERSLRNEARSEQNPAARKLLQKILTDDVDFIKGLAKFLYRASENINGVSLDYTDLNKIFSLMAIGPSPEPNTENKENLEFSLKRDLASEIAKYAEISPTPDLMRDYDTTLTTEVLRNDLISSMPRLIQDTPNEGRFFVGGSGHDMLKALRKVLITYLRAYEAKKKDTGFLHNARELSEKILEKYKAYESKKKQIEILIQKRVELKKQGSQDNTSSEIKDLEVQIAKDLTVLQNSFYPNVVEALEDYRKQIGILTPTLAKLDNYMLHEVTNIKNIIVKVSEGIPQASLGFFSRALGKNPIPRENAVLEFSESELDAFRFRKMDRHATSEMENISRQLEDENSPAVFDAGLIDEAFMEEVKKEVKGEEISPTKKVLFGIAAFTVVAGSIIWYRKSKYEKS